MDASDDELDSLIKRARLLAAAGRWNKEAVAVNIRILRSRRRSLTACNRLATCCLYLGHLDQAERLCRLVLQHDPYNYLARERLDAVTKRRAHELIAESAPTFEDAFQQGLAARKRRNHQLAVVLLEKACRLQASDACRIALAASYRATGRLADAESIYHSILERGFNEAAVVGLAGVRRDQGRFDEALALDKDVLDQLPHDDHAQWGLRGIEAERCKPLWERKAFITGARTLRQPAEECSVPQKPISPVEVYFDGLCHPRNPGGYACGGWYIAPYPEFPALAAGLEGHAFYCHGKRATNNLAEYSAALDALRAVYRSGHTGEVLLHGDSKLVINQFDGTWKCRKPELQHLLDRLQHAATFFEKLEVMWVPREQNERADEQSRRAYREVTRSARG